MKAPFTCRAAHSRQTFTSAWNCSNGFPVPGRTFTLGPAGAVAQPAHSIVVATATMVHRARIAASWIGVTRGIRRGPSPTHSRHAARRAKKLRGYGVNGPGWGRVQRCGSAAERLAHPLEAFGQERARGAEVQAHEPLAAAAEQGSVVERHLRALQEECEGVGGGG